MPLPNRSSPTCKCTSQPDQRHHHRQKTIPYLTYWPSQPSVVDIVVNSMHFLNSSKCISIYCTAMNGSACRTHVHTLPIKVVDHTYLGYHGNVCTKFSGHNALVSSFPTVARPETVPMDGFPRSGQAGDIAAHRATTGVHSYSCATVGYICTCTPQA